MSKVCFLVFLQEQRVRSHLSNHAGCKASVPEGTVMPDCPPCHCSGFSSFEELQHKSVQAVAASPGKTVLFLVVLTADGVSVLLKESPCMEL